MIYKEDENVCGSCKKSYEVAVRCPICEKILCQSCQASHFTKANCRGIIDLLKPSEERRQWYYNQRFQPVNSAIAVKQVKERV